MADTLIPAEELRDEKPLTERHPATKDTFFFDLISEINPQEPGGVCTAVHNVRSTRGVCD